LSINKKRIKQNIYEIWVEYDDKSKNINSRNRNIKINRKININRNMSTKIVNINR